MMMMMIKVEESGRVVLFLERDFRDKKERYKAQSLLFLTRGILKKENTSNTLKNIYI